MGAVEVQIPDSFLLRCFRLLDEQQEEGHEVRLPATDPAPRAGPWRRLQSFQGRLVDRVAVRIIEQLLMSGGRPSLQGNLRARIDRTRALYANPSLFQDPDRFFRPGERPGPFAVRRLGRLPRGERLELTFPSTYRTFDPSYEQRYRTFEANCTNHVRLWHHRGGGRPAVLCIHPWCAGTLQVDERLLAAAELYRLGLDVCLFTMPFHGRRTPRQARFSGQLFPSRELQRTNEAFGQAVSDLRWLMSWLTEEQGCTRVGMLGMSLGGYMTALMAAVEPSLAFAVPIVAPASFADLMWQHGQGRSGRKEAEAAGFTLQDFRAIWAICCPLVHPLRLPRQRVLIVYGEGDHVIPAVHQRALWEHWGRPEVRTFAGGHVLQLGRSGYLQEILAWLGRTVSGI